MASPLPRQSKSSNMLKFVFSKGLPHACCTQRNNTRPCMSDYSNYSVILRSAAGLLLVQLVITIIRCTRSILYIISSVSALFVRIRRLASLAIINPFSHHRCQVVNSLAAQVRLPIKARLLVNWSCRR